MPFESFQNFQPIRRNHVMGHERFGAQLPYAYAFRFGKGMPRRDHKHQLIAKDYDRLQSRSFWTEREHTKFHRMRGQLLRDRTGKGTMNGDLDHGAEAAEFFQ